MPPPPRRILHLCRVLSIAATCATLATAALAGGPNYWIDESTDFTGNGCENADLNDVTSSLRSRLDMDGPAHAGRMPMPGRKTSSRGIWEGSITWPAMRPH
jgi:hypothetical protein